jgi:hypothetical protein
MKARTRMAMALPGLLLLLLPACIALPPGGTRQPGPYPLQQSMANAGARDAYPRSPYGPLPDVPRVVAKRPVRRPDPPPEEEEPEVETARLPAPVQEPEVEGTPLPFKLASAPAPATPEPQPLASTVVESPLIQAVRCFVDKRPDLAVEQLQQFPAENQDALLVLLPLTVRMTEENLRESNPQEMAAMVDQLQQLLQTLQPMATLVLDKLSFCRDVQGFGKYEKCGEHPVFHAEEWVHVYAEIRNLSCEQVSSRKGSYRTHVISKLEIRDAAGVYIWKPHEREKDDYNQTPQHDYFHHYRFALPVMPPGEYTLFLEVTDVPTGRKVKRKLDFHVNG